VDLDFRDLVTGIKLEPLVHDLGYIHAEFTLQSLSLSVKCYEIINGIIICGHVYMTKNLRSFTHVCMHTRLLRF